MITAYCTPANHYPVQMHTHVARTWLGIRMPGHDTATDGELTMVWRRRKQFAVESDIGGEMFYFVFPGEFSLEVLD